MFWLEQFKLKSAVLVALVCGLQSVGWAEEPAAIDQGSTPRKAAMVFSGGISLGAYQAGVSFVLMKTMIALRQAADSDKQAEALLQELERLTGQKTIAGYGAGDHLLTLTGASAGNINAFLGAMTWCDASPNAITPANNLFRDAWINVGWAQLAPDTEGCRAYARSFEAPDADNSYPTPTKEDIERWCRGDVMYTDGDFLVTRQGFEMAERHLKTRLKLPDRYRKGCELTIGVSVAPVEPDIETVTASSGNKALRGMRWVVPLRVSTEACTQGPEKCALSVASFPPTSSSNKFDLSMDRNISLWPEGKISTHHHRLNTVGVMRSESEQRGEGLTPEDVVTLFKVSSANQFGFAPLHFPHCVSGGDGGAGCAKGMSPVKSRYFFDGGTFDNIPLGLAMSLVTEAHNQDERADYFYVDPEIVRAKVDPVSSRDINGLGLLGRLLGQGFKESRLYEIQGIARYERTKLGLDHSDPAQWGFRHSTRRFFIAGNFLMAFGAFLHIDFRRHDYRVGLYDGLHTVAKLIHDRSPKGGTGSEHRALYSDVFRVLAAALLAPPSGASPREKALLAAQQRTITALFAEEARLSGHTDGLSKSERDLLVPESGSKCRSERPALNCGAWGLEADSKQCLAERKIESVRVDLLCVLRDIVAARSKSPAVRIEAESLETDLKAFMRRLSDMSGPTPASDLAPNGDIEAWNFNLVSLLTRRFIDVEGQRPPTPEEAEMGGKDLFGLDPDQLLPLAHMVESMFLERDLSDPFDTAVTRMAAGHWSKPLGHLLPHYLTLDVVGSAAEVGYEPRSRHVFPGSPINNVSVLFAVGARFYPRPRLAPTRDWALWRGAVGMGLDFEGRKFEDLSLSWGAWFEPGGELAAHGPEVSFHALGDLLRVAVSWQIGVEDRFDPHVGNAYHSLSLQVGFADIGALIYGGLRSFGAHLVGEESHSGVEQ